MSTATKFATLRNRYTGAAVKVKLGRTGKLISVSAETYRRALAKLGHGPTLSTESFIVVNRAGDMRAAVERTE